MNKFIVFEGIDGCGKSTLSKKIADKLKWNWTKEPTFSSEYADKLNLESKDDEEREVEFAIDRIKHIYKLTNKKNSVVCDRYIWTGLAYCLKFNPKAFNFIKKFYSHSFFTKPDFYIFVDTPVEICLQRISERDNTSQSLEMLETLGDLRIAFYDVKEIIEKYSKVINIQGIGNTDETIDKIIEQIG